MLGEMERSPMLTTSGSGDFTGLVASSTVQTIGREGDKLQALSDNEANDLCREYLPLVLSEAGRYRNRGVAFDDLRSAGYLGLLLAYRRYDPSQGTFGAYASYWIRGEIRALFKNGSDLFSLRRRSLTVWNDDGEWCQTDVADDAPVIAPDLSALSERDRHIIESRAAGRTLADIGKGLGISAERVRQLAVRAHSQIKGATASQCISDLTRRGKVIRFPTERTRRFAEFKDREPPNHSYREPQATRQLIHHRGNAPRLAELRGGGPLRRVGGPYGGPVIHTWGRSKGGEL